MNNAAYCVLRSTESLTRSRSKQYCTAHYLPYCTAHLSPMSQSMFEISCMEKAEVFYLCIQKWM